MKKRLLIKNGKKFSRLVIVKELGTVKSSRMFLCKCSCGKYKTTRLSGLVCGNVRSCGCLSVERMQYHPNRTTHGMSNTRFYRCWKEMKARCNNKKHKNYNRYGGRGITYCNRWEIFKNFYNDMRSGYKGHLTIDRIDNNGSYCKENCRWATRKEQANNR